MKKTWLAGIVAGAALTASGVAFGQMEAPKLLDIRPDLPNELLPVGATSGGGGYNGRVEGAIFSNDGNGNISTVQSGSAAGNTCWANDFSFAGTGWAGATGRVATGLEFLYFNTGPDNQAFYVRIRLYKSNPVTEFSFNGATGSCTPMVAASAVPFYDTVFTWPAVYPHNTGNPMYVRPAGGIAFPNGTDQFYFVMQACSDPAGTIVLPATAASWEFTQSAVATTTNAAGPGVDAVDLGRDQGNCAGGAANLILDGSATIGGTSDHRQNLAPNGFAMAPSFTVLYTVPTVAPTPTFDFGCLTDGVTTRNTDAITANHVAWYKFCVSSNATDDNTPNGRFVDMHTHGSGIADTVMALYSNDGTLQWVADDDGTDLQSMLSFGIGRRASVVAGGEQRDGFGFIGTGKGLTAADGPYWIGIAPYPVDFQPGWQYSGAWAGGGVSLSFETNVNGGALAPSIAPEPAAADVGGVLVAPGFQAVAGQWFQGVRWFSFNLCRATDATNTVAIDYTLCDVGASWQAALFDGQGNQITTTAGSPPATMNFGASPSLAAGNYYVGISYNYGVDYATNPTTAGRWHMRDRAGSNWNNGLTVAVSWNDCAAPSGCTADFNCDGDIGTDLDISSFFACLSGTCPAAPCTNTADFNNDGDIGTDGDIESFFRVLGGGPC